MNGSHPDNRSQKAIEAVRVGAHTDVFKMVDVRGVSLVSHAAVYAATAVYDASDPSEAERATIMERKW